MLKINVLLAEMAEARLADEIQRLPFDRRIERLRRYVASLAETGTCQSERNASSGKE
jgi:hypothetical protein